MTSMCRPSRSAGDTDTRKWARAMVASYDGDLQMFREPGREPDPDVLRFLRWLAERDELEHQLSGPSSGELVDVVQPAHA